MIYTLKFTFKNIYLFCINRYYRQFILLCLFHGDNPRYKRKKVSFLSYRFDVPDTMSFIWQFKEIFVDEYYYFSADRKDPLIYDCGANIGTSCLYFKSLYPLSRIKAFEADPAIADDLKKNLLKNNVSGIEITSAAVWISNKGIELVTEGSDAASVFGDGNKIRIPSLSLKELLEKEDSVDMLKMDIEGAETEVIKDCREVLKKVKNLFIEYHSFTGQQQELGELLRILQHNGFRYQIYSGFNRTRPFTLFQRKDPGMDLQLNIFAIQNIL